MNATKPLLEDVLKDALAYLREPLLFSNMLQDSDGLYEWKLLEWDFSEFAEKLGDLKLPFRVGCNARIMVENTCHKLLYEIVILISFLVIMITSLTRCHIFFRILNGRDIAP